MPNGKNFDIWVIPANVTEEFKHLFCIQAKTAISVFDLTQKKSFDKALVDIKDFRKVQGKDIPVILCGAKGNLKSEFTSGERDVLPSLLANNGVKYYETDDLNSVFSRIC